MKEHFAQQGTVAVLVVPSASEDMGGGDFHLAVLGVHSGRCTARMRCTRTQVWTAASHGWASRAPPPLMNPVDKQWSRFTGQVQAEYGLCSE
jgi:hypothetical protein